MVDIVHLPGDCAGLGEVTVGVGVAHRAVSADTMLIIFYIPNFNICSEFFAILQMNNVPFGMYVSNIK